MNAIVLYNYSMIESMDNIESFYRHLSRGNISAKALKQGKNLFKSIGTCDPLASTTKRIGKALIRRMKAATGEAWTYYIGSKHTAPHMADVAKKCIQDGVKRIITVPSTPLYSNIGSKRYEYILEKSLQESDILIRHISHYYDNEAFIDLLADRLNDAISWLPSTIRHRAEIIFVAHSMPGVASAHQEFIRQYKYLARRLTEKVAFTSYEITYRSAGPSPQRWLEPDIIDVIQKAAESGKKAIVACELLSIIENAEVIQEVGRDAQEMARSLNMEFVQTEYVNDSDDFLHVLEAMCLEKYTLLEEVN